MRDVFRHGMLRADGTSIDAVAFTGLGHGVIARVEVFAVLEVLCEVVGPRGKFAVKSEEALLLGGERLDVDLVLLMGIHSDVGSRPW